MHVTFKIDGKICRCHHTGAEYFTYFFKFVFRALNYEFVVDLEYQSGLKSSSAEFFRN